MTKQEQAIYLKKGGVIMTEKERMIYEILQADKEMAEELAYNAIKRKDFTTYFQFISQKASYEYMQNLISMSVAQLKTEIGYKGSD